MRRRRIRWQPVLIFIVAWALSGCRDGSSEATVLRFWAMGREGEVVRQLLLDFEHTHPDVRVEVQQLPWTAAHQKLLTAFAGGALPDVAQLGNTWLPEFVALHAVDTVEPSVVDASDYFPGIWQTNVIDEAAYGVPWYVDTRLLFYRRDLLAAVGYSAPPATWPQWIEMLGAIKRRGGARTLGLLLPLNEYEPLLALALQQDEPLLRDENGRGNFRSEGFRRALGFYREMFDRGLAPATSSNQVSNLWDEFARGYFSFYITGPWSIGEFKRRLPASLQASWMTAPLPGPNGPGRRLQADQASSCSESPRIRRRPGSSSNTCPDPTCRSASTHSLATYRRGAAHGATRAWRRTPMRAPFASSSNASNRLHKCPNGSASLPRCSSSPSRWCRVAA